MAENFQTLAHLLKLNTPGMADNNVSDLLNDAPLLRKLAADAIAGTVHKYLKEIAAPAVGFRDINVGRENSASDDQEVTCSLKVLDCTFDVDVAYADGYVKGREAAIAREAARHVRAGLFSAEKQILSGVTNDASGFVGLLAGYNSLTNGMVVNAGGNTESAGTTSVWAIRTGIDDALIVAGNEGLLDVKPTTVIQRVDGTGKRLPAYYTPIYGWLGLQIGGAYSVGRICNIQDGHTLTDDLVSELISRFPAARQPNLIVMNRTARAQLQKSRTAVNATGAPAPFPTEVHGVEIVCTDAITDNEDLVS